MQRTTKILWRYRVNNPEDLPEDAYAEFKLAELQEQAERDARSASKRQIALAAFARGLETKRRRMAARPELIREALITTNGQRARAAKMLGLSKSTFYVAFRQMQAEAGECEHDL